MMKQIHQLVVMVGSRINPRLLVAILLALNVSWVVILLAIGSQFQEVAGFPLLDLQNEISADAIITPSKVMEQIATYTQETKTLYWSFFILDNVMPQLTFGAFALLWVRFLQSNPSRLYIRLLHSYVLLIPLGVGFFDWIENLGYLTAIHEYPGVGTLPAIYIGLAAKWVKALCLQITFLLTLPMIVRHLYNRIQRVGQRDSTIQKGVV